MTLNNSNYLELGSLKQNLVLNTLGKIKIRFGKKFVDMLNEKGELNVPSLKELEERIEVIEKKLGINNGQTQ